MEKKAIEVQGVLLIERPGGVRVLVISTKNGPLELEFSVTLWEKLTDTARWFKNGHRRGKLEI